MSFGRRGPLLPVRQPKGRRAMRPLILYGFATCRGCLNNTGQLDVLRRIRATNDNVASSFPAGNRLGLRQLHPSKNGTILRTGGLVNRGQRRSGRDRGRWRTGAHVFVVLGRRTITPVSYAASPCEKPVDARGTRRCAML